MISIFQCHIVNGVQVNIYSEEVVCFTGVHYLHLTVAIIICIIFISFSMIVALTFFEIHDEEESSSAR